jgi:cell division protein FtsB
MTASDESDRAGDDPAATRHRDATDGGEFVPRESIGRQSAAREVPDRRSGRRGDPGIDRATGGADRTSRADRAGRRTARRSGASTVSRLVGRLTTRRAAVLALVVCALALSIAVPLRTYLAQHDELQAQLAQQQTLRAQASQLAQLHAKLSDPAQVEAEARTRLHYVMPGETPYVVQLPGNGSSANSGQAGQQPSSNSVWYQQLWQSITQGQH